ncbi:MAG TPA: O-antigen ligase family protein [Trueperaceae bacterium]
MSQEAVYLSKTERMARAVFSVERACKISQALFWISLLAVYPVIINPFGVGPQSTGSFHAFTMPKIIALSITWLIGLVGTLLAYSDFDLKSTPYRLLRAPSGIQAYVGFLVTMCVTAFLTPNSLGFVLLGREPRFDGVLVQLLWYSLPLLAFASALRSRLSRRFPLIAAEVGGGLVAIWMSLQGFGLEPLELLNPAIVVAGRPSASLWHPALATAWVAGVLILSATWTVLRGRIHAWRIGLVFVLTMAVFFGGGRAAIIGALLAWILVAGIGCVKGQGGRRRLVVLISTIMMAGALTAIWSSAASRSQITSLTEASRGQDRSFSSRLITWQVGLTALAARPLTGFGPGFFSEAVWNYASPEQEKKLYLEFFPARLIDDVFRAGTLLTAYDDEAGRMVMIQANYDKAHNYLLDLALANGLPALLLFLASVVLLLRPVMRAPSIEALAISASLLTFAIFAQAWFATFNLDPMFLGLAGLAAGTSHRELGRKRLAEEAV